MQTVNAQIIDTHLGFEDHGIFTWSIVLSFGGYHQSYGGYNCEGQFLWMSLRDLFTTVGVDNWSELQGRFVRVDYADDRRTFIEQIRNIMDDDLVLNLKKLGEEFLESKS